MKKIHFLFFILFSFTVSAQHKAVKDSFAYYQINNQSLKALKYSDKKATYFLHKKDYPNYVRQIINKTNIFNYKLEDYKKSYDILYQALKIIEGKKLYSEETLLQFNLGKALGQLNLNNKAITFHKKALSLTRKNKNDSLFLPISKLIIFNYIKLKKTDSCYRYLNTFLAESKKRKNYMYLSNGYNMYYSFYTQIQERDVAKKYLDSCIYYAEKSGVKSTILTAKTNLGVHYLLEEKNYIKARNLYLELINDKKSNYSEEDKSYFNLNISMAYENLGDYKNALKYQTDYLNYAETSYLSRINEEVENINTKYEIEKAEKEFNQKTTILKQKQFRNEKLMYLLLSLLALAGVLFYFFYQNLKLKQKNKLKDVTHKSQQNLINATIDGQEEERKRLSGVLHDNISALLSSASLHITAFEATHPEMKDELKKTKNILKEAHDKVRDLSHDLIPPVLEKLGLVAAFEDLCDKNSNSLIHFNFNNFITENSRFQVEFEMKLYFIVAELFNNIIKHSNASEAFLTIDKNENQLTINIEDNGKGFNTKEGKTSGGLGLSQIKTRIKSLNGSLTINSKEKSGTIIYIKVEIPK